MKLKIKMRASLYHYKDRYFDNQNKMFDYIDKMFKQQKIDYVEVYFKNESDEWLLLSIHDQWKS